MFALFLIWYCMYLLNEKHFDRQITKFDDRSYQNSRNFAIPYNLWYVYENVAKFSNFRKQKGNFKSFHTSETINLLILNSSFTYFHIGGEDHALFGLDFMSKWFPIRIFLHLSVFLNILKWFHIKVFIICFLFLLFHHLCSKTNYSLTACKDSWLATDLFDWERLSTNILLVITKLKPKNLFLHQVLRDMLVNPVSTGLFPTKRF